jgi:hypothetical protein
MHSKVTFADALLTIELRQLLNERQKSCKERKL